MKKIGIIGFGNMGSAIGERIKSAYTVSVFDKDRNKTESVSAIKVEGRAQEVAEDNEAIILAVKPQDFDNSLQEIKDFTRGKLIVSIAAGITTAYIEKILKGARVIRVMPNLPARIGRGVSCLCKGKSAASEDLGIAEELFKMVGETLIVDEKMLDAATAISGSGPAYVCDFLESGGEKEIFLRDFQGAAQALGLVQARRHFW